MKSSGFILVTGGARSGKTAIACRLTRGKVIYLATAQGLDNEMKKRIESHKRSRPQSWITIEEPIHVADAIKKIRHCKGSVIIDCLTLLISNLMSSGMSDKSIIEELGEIARLCSSIRPRVIVVTNEVGLGIVPATRSSRRFRDLAGLVNQLFAKNANRVYLTVAGIPLRIK